MNFEIRKVQLFEVSALSKVASETYRATYTGIDPPDDLTFYIENTFNIDLLKTQIASKDIIFYILWEGNKAIGYFKLWLWKSRGNLNPKESIELEKIYIRKAYHRKGLGRKLIQSIFDVIADYDAKWLWLCVWAKNDKAIAFYESMGLEIFAETYFITGNSSKPNFMMRKDISK